MILIMIIIGGVSASEDIDSVSSSGDLNATLKVNGIDEVDNLASDNGADSDDGNLKATDDNEVLGDGGNFASLNTQISSTNYKIDIFGDYTADGAQNPAMNLG